MTTSAIDIVKLRRTLLVLDDEPALRQLIRTIFKPEGFDVLEAEDALNAFHILEAQPVGVVLIDKNLPSGLSGLAVLQDIPRICPYTKGIVLTGYPSTDSAIEALRAQAFDYVVKPCSIDELKEKVAAAVAAIDEEYAADALMRKHAALFETVPGVVWFLAQDGIIKRINQEGARVLGYDTDQLIGQPYEILMADEEAPSRVHWAFKERRTGKRASRRVKVELRTAEGEDRIFEIYSTGAYLEKPGPTGLLGTVGVAHDITEMIRLETELNQAAKMDALGRLAGGVAHDFNNSLAIILGNVALGNSRLAEDNPVRDVLRDIEIAARDAARVTEQLLSFSRKGPIFPVRLDVSDYLTECARLVSRLIGDAIGVDVHTSTESAWVEIDRGQIQQILLNLAANARDAMPDGGTLRLAVTVVDVDEEDVMGRPGVAAGDYVQLAVTDSGLGMSPEVREHIFEPFFTTKTKGTGLGLATVYGIVRQLGGFIDVRSEQGTGSTIVVHLPRQSAVAPSEANRPRIERGSLGKVLVVEDEPLLRRVTRSELEEAGFEVVAVADGVTALAAHDAWKDQLDVLVTDVVMSEMNGAELAEQMLERQPELRIVFMSAYGSGAIGALAERPGCRFLRKPFGAGRVAETVAELLAEQRG